MNPLLRYLLPLAAFTLTACDGDHRAPSTLSPQAAAEYVQMCESLEGFVQRAIDRLDKDKPFFGREDEFNAEHRRLGLEILSLLEDFEESGDVRLTTPTAHQTVLHFAVQNRKETLVAELLQQGADPNATCQFPQLSYKELDAPLTWAVVPYTEDDKAAIEAYGETAIRLIDTLVAAGARVDGDAGGHALLFNSLITTREGAEDVYLHLLKLGANPRLGYLRHKSTGDDNEGHFNTVVDFLLRARWPRALRTLIDMEHLPVEWRNDELKTLLFLLVEEQVTGLRGTLDRKDESLAENIAEVKKDNRERLELIRILLEHGADPNSPQGGGWTSLAYAACLPPQEAEFTPAWQELIDLLLRHGGDPNTTVPAHHDKPVQKVSELLKN